ncbi:MAG: hypothetical protein COZ05_08035 [Armatimonadetes bacterium CG_4_10_14_3_um_filter_59_10]|nr:MAG: hypothetical protein COZ05_08035 [Armatimonadetes bacterium CG_4_10_14_3_um_filter_59_10]
MADQSEPRSTIESQEAARLLDISYRTLTRWRQRGYGPPWARVGGRVRYTTWEVRAWLDDQRKGGGR